MAYTTINKSTEHFNTKLYTGANKSVTGVGFQPDWVWIKERDAGYHSLFDAIRGATEVLSTNVNAAGHSVSDSLTSFDSDGFTLGADSSNYVGGSSQATVSWNWKANGAGSTNYNGSINSTVSANTTAGFSIVKYTGNGVSGATIGHGLGVAPKIVQIKKTSASDNWSMLNTNVDLQKYLRLDSNSSLISDPLFNNTAPSTTVFTVDSDGQVNGNGNEFIAYCFAEVTGFSKFGSYTGNNGMNFIYTGFKPKWCMFKRTDSDDNWKILDDKRSTYNIMNKTLSADTSSAEATESDVYVDFLSNGIRLDGTNGAVNANGGNYIYMTFGQSLVGSNDIPCTAR